MGYPLNNGGPFVLDVDASDVGIGGVLHQIQEGCERVIAYASRALNEAEKNYCITEKELLAVRYFVEYFRQYLLGRRFVVRTDHQALVWLYRLKEPSGKIARWIEILSHYDFGIEYRQVENGATVMPCRDAITHVSVSAQSKTLASPSSVVSVKTALKEPRT